ncbi:MAG: hypothetical protein ACRDYU_05790 [Actinomycetes bacterium]
MRVPVFVLATTLATATVTVVAPTSANAQVLECQVEVPIVGDIDSDGQADLAVGVPNRMDDTGGVDLRLTRADDRVLTRTIAGLGAGAAGDRFGASVALGDLEDDGCDEIVTGAPGVSGDAGRVYVVFGAADTGFESTGAITLDDSSSGDRFGAAVALSPNEAGAGFDLWVGAPFDDVDGVSNAGSVTHYAVTASGGEATVGPPIETLTQNSAGVPGVAEAGDHFGAVLSATRLGVFVGQPDEAIGTQAEAGSMTLLQTSDDDVEVDGAFSWSQDSPGVAGDAEAGDRFGAAVNALSFFAVVGVPGEDLGTRRNAGLAQTFLPETIVTVEPGHGVTQDAPGIPGDAEAGDRFGAAAVMGNNLTCFDDAVDAAVGAPGEDLRVGGSTRTNAGTVIAFNIRANEDCTARSINQNTSLGGAPEDGDQLGSTLSLRRRPDDQDDISDRPFVGVPGEDYDGTTDAGLVQVTPPPLGNDVGAGSGFSNGPRADLRYGTVIGSPAEG